MFNRRATEFHGWAKLYELNFFIRKTFPLLDGQTRWAKIILASSLMKPLISIISSHLANPDHTLSVFHPEQLSKKLSAFKDPLLDLTGDSPVPDEVNSMY